jgi:hypothetical protein
MTATDAGARDGWEVTGVWGRGTEGIKGPKSKPAPLKTEGCGTRIRLGVQRLRHPPREILRFAQDDNQNNFSTDRKARDGHGRKLAMNAERKDFAARNAGRLSRSQARDE